VGLCNGGLVISWIFCKKVSCAFSWIRLPGLLGGVLCWVLFIFCPVADSYLPIGIRKFTAFLLSSKFGRSAFAVFFYLMFFVYLRFGV